MVTASSHGSSFADGTHPESVRLVLGPQHRKHVRRERRQRGGAHRGCRLRTPRVQRRRPNEDRLRGGAVLVAESFQCGATERRQQARRNAGARVGPCAAGWGGGGARGIRHDALKHGERRGQSVCRRRRGDGGVQDERRNCPGGIVAVCKAAQLPEKEAMQDRSVFAAELQAPARMQAWSDNAVDLGHALHPLRSSRSWANVRPRSVG